jgi:hypothetical protein
MDFGTLIQKDNDAWLLKRATLSKEEISFIGDKDTLRGKICGFMTAPYYKRTNLITSSELAWAYVFKEWSNDTSSNEVRHPTWLLFSPSREIQLDPSPLENISAQLLSIALDKTSDHETKKLFKLIHENLSDAAYYEIPGQYTGGVLCYLSIVYVENRLNPFFRLGYNYILMSPSVSKEVLYLPERFMSEEYKTAYFNGSLAKEER